MADRQARLQRRHLRQRRTGIADFAPGVGRGARQFPALGGTPVDARFAAADTGVHVVCAGGAAHHPGGVVEQDEVLHAARVQRGPGVHLGTVELQADVQLRGALGLHAGKGVGRTDGAARGREQLPVVGHALRVAEAGVRAPAATHVVLVADERTGQRLPADHAGGGIGHRHHAAGAGAQVLRFGAVDAHAAHHVMGVGDVPVRFGEGAPAVELGVHAPRQREVGPPPAGAAPAVPAVAQVHAGGHFPAPGLPGGGDAAAARAVRHVAGHRHGHAAGGVGVAQAVVVHHVVHVVLVDVGDHGIEHAADMLLLEAQAQAVAAELRAVHAAAGVARLGVADAGAEFQHRVFVGRPAERGVCIPLLPRRRHPVAIAVFVVVGLGTVGGHARIAPRRTGADVQHLVVAVAAAGQQAAGGLHARLGEVRDLALEAHRAGGSAAAPQHRLRPLDDDQAVVGFRRDVRQRVVHARGTGAAHRAVVGHQVDARAEHAAQHRIAVGTAAAQRGEAGNGLQVVRSVAGRHRLPRQFGIGDEGGGHGGRHADHHDAVQRGGGHRIGMQRGVRFLCLRDRHVRERAQQGHGQQITVHDASPRVMPPFSRRTLERRCDKVSHRCARLT